MVAQGEGHWELLCYSYWQPIASWFPLAERSGLSPFLAILLGWGADRAGCVGVCDKPTHAVCFVSSLSFSFWNFFNYGGKKTLNF